MPAGFGLPHWVIVDGESGPDGFSTGLTVDATSGGGLNVLFTLTSLDTCDLLLTPLRTPTFCSATATPPPEARNPNI